YVGQIAVSGMSVEQVRTAVAAGLAGRAVDPQVQATLAGNGGNRLAVVGDVAQPGQFDVPVSGLRLIEAVALAGGARQPGFETEVTVVRGNARATMRFDDVVNDTRNNIWLMPRDTLQVLHRPRSYTAFGAVTS